MGPGMATPSGAGNYADTSALETLPGHGINAIAGYTDGYPTTAPVMSFKPNKLGLYDMGGRLAWCEDWFNEKREHRVLRGGSWIWGAENVLRSSGRAAHLPTTRLHDLGFRSALVVGDIPGTVGTIPNASGELATKDAPLVNSLGMRFVPVQITGGPDRWQERALQHLGDAGAGLRSLCHGNEARMAEAGLRTGSNPSGGECELGGCEGLLRLVDGS